MTEQHQHEWRPVEGATGIQAWACTACEETSATCGTCGRASGTSLLLCQHCERHAARVLADIAAALDRYETAPRSGYPSPGDMRLVPGYGSSRGGVQSPEDVTARMLTWVARWTEHVGASKAAPPDFLRSHHIWAAHHPEASLWPEYLDDMRKLRAQTRGMAGLLPKRLPEPCVHCGGQVVQDWADAHWKPLRDGLSDVVRCTGCGMTWGDHARWRFATRHHIVALPNVLPDTLVTLAQARMIWPDVPSATLRSWAQRWREDGDQMIERALLWWSAEQMRRAGERPWWAPADWAGPGEAPSLAGWLPEYGERDGTAMYRVGDLEALVERWADDTRRGRRSVTGSATAG